MTWHVLRTNILDFWSVLSDLYTKFEKLIIDYLRSVQISKSCFESASSRELSSQFSCLYCEYELKVVTKKCAEEALWSSGDYPH